MINRTLLRLLVLFSVVLIGSCGQTETKKDKIPEIAAPLAEVVSFPHGTILNHTTAEGSSFALYTPSDYSQEKKYPVIIFLDPHGKGSFPLKKYKSLADHFGFFLIGSNDSKNGIAIEDGVSIVQYLMTECKSLPFFNGNISLCGFSGGAKLALVAGNSVSKFNSIIYCGAALPVQSIMLNTPLLGFAGRRDMNYTEVKIFSSWAARQVPFNGIAEWPGKHEWPDSTSFQHAFFWALLNGNLKKDDQFIDEYISFIDKILDNEKNLLRRVELLNNKAALLEKYVLMNDYKKRIIKIRSSPEYKKAKENEINIITNEDNRKQELINSYLTKDLAWWTDEINRLLAEKDNEINERLLGYISLASWSYSSRAVAKNDIPLAMKSLEIYRLADPENPEPAFLRASLYAGNNNSDSAVYFLKEAIILGLTDRSKIENDKNLSTLRGRSDYEEVMREAKFEY